MINTTSKQPYLTVGELVEQLQGFDQELPVSIDARKPSVYLEDLDRAVDHPLIEVGLSEMRLGQQSYKPCLRLCITDGDNDLDMSKPPTDTERMDWLERKLVELANERVNGLVYMGGVRMCFQPGTEMGEYNDEDFRLRLLCKNVRAGIDAALKGGG